MFYVDTLIDFNCGPVWAVYRPNGQMRSCWTSEAKAQRHADTLNASAVQG